MRWYVMPWVPSLVIGILLGCHGLARDKLHDLRQFAKNVRQCRQHAALALGLVHKGQIVFSDSFGKADLARNKHATSSTPFAIGSLTKAFTSMLLAMMLQDRKDKGLTPIITWDTPIRDILGSSFRFYDDVRTQKASLRDLLSHRMAFPAYERMLIPGFPSYVSRKNLVRRLRFMRAQKPFRSAFMYNNYMVMLAGHVAENLDGNGTTWEDLVRQRIFTPLQMTSSGVITEKRLPSNLAQAYASVDDKLVKVNQENLRSVIPLGPAGSIYTTSDDMTKWIRFITSMGRGPDGNVLVGRQLFNSLFEGSIAKPFSHLDRKYPVSDRSVSAALGWLINKYRGYTKVWHGGGISTYRCQIWIFPEKRSGAYVCSNGPWKTGLYEIMAYASDLILGETPWVSQKMLCEKAVSHCSRQAPKSPFPLSKLSRPLGTFAGTYGHLVFGNITVYLNRSSRSLCLRWGRLGQARLKLSPGAFSDTFSGQWTGLVWFYSSSDKECDTFPVRFSRDGNGDKLITFVDFNRPSHFIKNIKIRY